MLAQLAFAASMALMAAGSAPPDDAAMQPFFGAILQIDNLEGWHARRWLAAEGVRDRGMARLLEMVEALEAT